MNLNYLADALDFWKRAMLDVLRESSARTVAILPMFTDEDPLGPPAADQRVPTSGWTERVDTYLALLGANRADLLTERPLSMNARRLTRAARQGYFNDARNKYSTAFPHADVFLDPNTGIAAKKARRNHIQPDEVRQFLSNNNIVAVYQHRVHKGGHWLEHYRRLLAGAAPEPIGYEGTQVGMLFVTHDRERAETLRHTLSWHLGAAANRILPPSPDPD